MANENKTNKEADALVAAGVPRKYAARVLSAVGTGRALGTLTASELRAAGVPDRTAERVAASIALGRRVTEPEVRPVVTCAADVARVVAPLVAGAQQEHFYVVCLDVRNQLIGEPIEVARGTVCGVEVHPREVFRAAIRASAAGVVLAHNHPSGDPTPSAEDVELTRRLKAAGVILGIPVVDHVVVASGGFRSLAEQMGDAL